MIDNKLVERLRTNNPDHPTVDRFEAADEIERLREIVEDLLYQFACHGHDGGGKYLLTGGLSALEAAFYVLGWGDPHYIIEGGCQHPGCKAWDTCGTPTPDGYRRLCGEHYRQLTASLAGGTSAKEG